ncbi:hypothetical protein FJTKL_05334 [Diaporthe vaccinii]|uniref:Uncharacterized protein n=1 Tax=Diaporthe vaccinii TaxID=105482 RepID=A0ABR4FFF8_9PEZI
MAIERTGSDLCVLISATDPRRIHRNVEQPCRRRNRDRVEHASGLSNHNLFRSSSPQAVNGHLGWCLLGWVVVASGGGSRLFGGGLALGTSLAADLDALQDGLAVLVELQLGDDDVGGVDAQRDGLARDLLAGDALDVDHVLETVHGGDLALLVLVGAADDLDLVILADGDAADLF